MKKILCLLFLAAALLWFFLPKNSSRKFDERKEVVFWHFWGGEDREIVDRVVEKFNQSQKRFVVRAVAMPGNNLNMKILASVAGGSPPDLVNIDDPVVGDWGHKKIIMPLEDFVSVEDRKTLEKFLVPPAKKLGKYQGKLYGVCNGLDLRALYINQTALEKHNLKIPRTTEQLRQLSFQYANLNQSGSPDSFPYLPDSRRFWSWGYVFGGQFYDQDSQKCQLVSDENIDAINWMKSFSEKFSPEVVSKFRAGDQSLPGKRFPLLPQSVQQETGRYWMIQDGQWRVRDIKRFNNQRIKAGLSPVNFVVHPLPRPKKFPLVKDQSAYGWVNGNVFVVPNRSKCSDGAWEFMKFWIGMTDPSIAAETCGKGGWIPVSKQVSETKEFQKILEDSPLYASFIQMSKSPNWSPIPVIPGAGRFRREVELVAGKCFQNPQNDPNELLEKANSTINQHLQRSKN